MESSLGGGKIKAVFFDFMGTCLDWHSSVVKAFPAELSQEDKSQLALEWRQSFFDYIRSRPLGENPEDIDTMHRRILHQVLARPANANISQSFLSEDGSQTKAVMQAVHAWHKMDAWPDVRPGMERIRSEFGDCELFVLANGTTRLQLDLVRSSNLDFDMLFSSELLGVAKPTPDVYQKALRLVKIEDPSHALMVAAHAYDLRAAKNVGMRTIYIRRWTDDLDETDDEKLSNENDGKVLHSFEDLAGSIREL